jgi:hypothetical protein
VISEAKMHRRLDAFSQGVKPHTLAAFKAAQKSPIADSLMT